jgi:RHS repeat-associated protein
MKRFLHCFKHFAWNHTRGSIHLRVLLCLLGVFMLAGVWAAVHYTYQSSPGTTVDSLSHIRQTESDGDEHTRLSRVDRSNRFVEDGSVESVQGPQSISANPSWVHSDISVLSTPTPSATPTPVNPYELFQQSAQVQLFSEPPETTERIIGDGVNKTFIITHSFNSNVLVQLFDTLNGNRQAYGRIKILNLNQVEISFLHPPLPDSILVNMVPSEVDQTFGDDFQTSFTVDSGLEQDVLVQLYQEDGLQITTDVIHHHDGAINVQFNKPLTNITACFIKSEFEQTFGNGVDSTYTIPNTQAIEFPLFQVIEQDLYHQVYIDVQGYSNESASVVVMNPVSENNLIMLWGEGLQNQTPTPTPTNSPTGTDTPSPTPTPEDADTPTPTLSPTPGDTETSTPTLDPSVTPSPTCNQNEYIDIPDANFRRAIEEFMGVSPFTPISVCDAEAKTGMLDASNRGIYDLSGIEYFKNITSLNISDNRIISLDLSDNLNLLSLIANNNYLRDLNIGFNTNLTSINLSQNHLSNLTTFGTLLGNGGFSSGGTVDVSFNFIPTDDTNLLALDTALSPNFFDDCQGTCSSKWYYDYGKSKEPEDINEFNDDLYRSYRKEVITNHEPDNYNGMFYLSALADSINNEQEVTITTNKTLGDIVWEDVWNLPCGSSIGSDSISCTFSGEAYVSASLPEDWAESFFSFYGIALGEIYGGEGNEYQKLDGFDYPIMFCKGVKFKPDLVLCTASYDNQYSIDWNEVENCDEDTVLDYKNISGEIGIGDSFSEPYAKTHSVKFTIKYAEVFASSSPFSQAGSMLFGTISRTGRIKADPTMFKYPCDTPTPTETPISSDTDTPTPTDTPVLSITDTPTTTETPVLSDTDTPTPSNTPNGSPTPTVTPTQNNGKPIWEPAAAGCEPVRFKVCDDEHVDPVYLFSGEFYLQEEDMRIKTGGIDFVWSRFYRHRHGPFTEMGNRWDYSYNIYVEEHTLGNMKVHNGAGRTDIYTVDPENPNLWTSTGYLRELTKDETTGIYTLTFENKSVWQFYSLDDTDPDHEPGRISEIRDTYGNALKFYYDFNGIDTDYIEIDDENDNDVALIYIENQYISLVEDRMGGVFIEYKHYQEGDTDGMAGDLKSIITDPVQKYFGEIDPATCATTYTYESGFLDHKLKKIIDAKGQVVLENVYEEYLGYNEFTEPLITQFWGGDDHRIDIFYERVIDDPIIVRKATINDREGNIVSYSFNDQNLVVKKVEYTGKANPTKRTKLLGSKVRSTDPFSFVTTYTWNENMLLESIEYPNGNKEEVQYPTSGTILRKGNITQYRNTPGDHLPAGDQTYIERIFEYSEDPTCGCNQLVSATDGEGNTINYSYVYYANGSVQQKTIAEPGDIITDIYFNEYGKISEIHHPKNNSGYRRVDTFEYYDNGFLEQFTEDSNGTRCTTVYTYDSRGNVRFVTDPYFNITEILYNELDQILRIIKKDITTGNIKNYVTDFHYDANGNVVKIETQNIDKDGNLDSENPVISTEFIYEPLNFLEEIRQEYEENNFITTRMHYDKNRNVIKTEFGEATASSQVHNTVSYQYDERQLVYIVLRGEGSDCETRTRLDYDGNKNLVKAIRGYQSDQPLTTYNFYDGYDRPVYSIDPMGNVAHRQYDSNSNLTNIQLWGQHHDDSLSGIPGLAFAQNYGQTDEGNVLLSEVSYSYDTSNRISSTTRSHFDSNGNIIGDGISQTTYQYYDESNLLESVKNDRDVTTTYTYNNRNRVDTITDDKENSVQYQYDNNGNIISKTEIDKSDIGSSDKTYTTLYDYDRLNRLIQLTNPDNTKTKYGYDSRGNMTYRENAREIVSLAKYDGLNRLVETIHGFNTLQEITTLNYWDQSSRLIGKIDGNGNTTAYKYDPLNRLTEIEYADGTKTSFTQFDVHDNYHTRTDANGSVASYVYDDLNRTTNINYSPASGVSAQNKLFKYDSLSRLKYAEDSDSLVTFDYDTLSNVLNETLQFLPDTQVYTTSSTYDAMGNRLNLTYPTSGRQITHSYDSLNRMNSITESSADIVNWKFMGPMVEQKNILPTSPTEQLTRTTFAFHNQLRQIESITHNSTAAGTFFSQSYTWDAVGNKTSRDELNGPRYDYTYDALHRMTQSVMTPDVGSAETISYSLDDVGNRTSVTGGSNPGIYTLDPTVPDPDDYRMNQYTITPFETGREYDLNGNLTLIDLSTGNDPVIEYDADNQMVSYTDDAGVVTTYKYDALGRRIEKSVGGTITRYLYDGSRVIEELDAGGTLDASYVYGRYIDEVIQMNRGGTEYYYHTDDMYNVMVVTDLTGNVVERYDYDDYGNPHFYNASGTEITQSAIDNPYLFNGRRYDPETGFYYYRTRYLDPQTARFTTRDTIGIWGDASNLGNGYTYVGNNPYTKVDPYGLDDDSITNVFEEINLRRQRVLNQIDGSSDKVYDQEAVELVGWLKFMGEELGQPGINPFFFPAAGAVGGSKSLLHGSKKVPTRIPNKPGFLTQCKDIILYPIISVYNWICPNTKKTPKISGSTALSGPFKGPYTKGIPAGTMDDFSARNWYLQQLDAIPGKIDKTQPLRDQARQAFDLRNQARTDARALMLNRNKADQYDISDPNRTWQEQIQYVVENYNKQGSEVWEHILESSTRSRPSVNESLGLKK